MVTIFLKGVAKEGVVATMVGGRVIQEWEEEDHLVFLDPEVEEETMDLFLEEICVSHNQGP